MIKFKYLFNGVHHYGFARKFTIQNASRYLVLLTDGLSLILTQTDDKSIWMQIPKNGETNQDNDLIQAIGSGLQNGEVI